ncbi:MAG: hypothetical protein A4E66_00165 [Syntrophus sp. PtaB.Bin001]|nr:MAG: hypothetical protein A4E66_00165 [Syntrophus sp. PtaB.Bin001]
MPQAKGSNSYLAFQEETTFGVPPSSPALKYLYFVSESLGETINLISSQVIRANRNPTKPVRGNRDVAGSIKTELAPSLGSFLKGALGASTPSGASSPYTHAISVDRELPSFTFEKGFLDLNKYLLFLGCKVNKFSLSAKAEGFQDVSIDFMGSCEAQALAYDTETATFNVGKTLSGVTSLATGLIKGLADAGTTGHLVLINDTGTFQNDEIVADDGSSPGSATANGTLGGVSLDSSISDLGHSPFDGFTISTVQEGGSDIAIVTTIELNIENNLDGSNLVIGGGGIRRSVPEGKIKVSGKVTCLFESMAMYIKAMRSTESSIKLIYQHGTGAGTDGNEYLEFYIPELYFSKETPVIEGPQGILYNGPFEAFYDDAAGASAIQITLKNAEATI